MKYLYSGPEKCFPGFLMTFSWNFHNIAVHSGSFDESSYFVHVNINIFILHIRTTSGSPVICIIVTNLTSGSLPSRNQRP